MEENGNQPPVNDPSNSSNGVNDEHKDQGNGSTNQNPSDNKGDKAYREQQSRADKATNERDQLNNRVAFLENFAADNMKNQLISGFLKENQTKYPDVTAEDLQKFVNSPDDLEEVAKHLQTKYQDIRQSTLTSVREVPDDSMTEQEKSDAKSKIKEDDPNRFGKWLSIQSKRTRK